MYITHCTHWAEIVQLGQGNRWQKLGLVWRNRKKISQIIKDYFYLPFFLLIILCWQFSKSAGRRGKSAGKGAIARKTKARWPYCLLSKSSLVSLSSFLFQSYITSGLHYWFNTLPAMLLKQYLSCSPFLSIPCYPVILHSCSCVLHIKATTPRHNVVESAFCYDFYELQMFSGLSTVCIQYTPWCYCPKQASSVPNAASPDWLRAESIELIRGPPELVQHFRL